MTGISLSLGSVFRIWWAIQWRGALVGMLFSAACYFLWQALPWPLFLSAGASEQLVYGTAALAAALTGVIFGLLTVRWFLQASFSELRLVVESQQPRDPPKFRIEPRIGNLVADNARGKLIPLERAGATPKQRTIGDASVSPNTQKPRAVGHHRSGYARPH
jgi:hypothetical protein